MYVCMYVCMYGHHLKWSMDRPGKVVNPARDQLNGGKQSFPVIPRSHLRIWSRETGSAVPSRVGLLILHTQAESGAYSEDSSRFLPRRPFLYTANRHRVHPESIRSRRCVPMAFISCPLPPKPGFGV